LAEDPVNGGSFKLRESLYTRIFVPINASPVTASVINQNILVLEAWACVGLRWMNT